MAGSLTRAQLLRVTGYVRLEDEGREVLDETLFYDALVEAVRRDQLLASPLSRARHDTESIKREIARNLEKIVIALPLLDQR